MPTFEDGTRIRVTKTTEFYTDSEATKPDGELVEGTQGTITVGQPFRGKVYIMTVTGIRAWVAHYCLEPVDAPPSEVTSGVFLQPIQSPENLRPDDIFLLADKLQLPYLETRQNAAIGLVHAYCRGILTSLDIVRDALMYGIVSFGPIAEVLWEQSQQEMAKSLLAHLKNAPAEIRDQALAEWERFEK